MTTRIIHIIELCLGLLLCGCSEQDRALSDTVRSYPQYAKVEMLRDKWGVPHIFARTDAGAMYGLGYAAAQDRAFQMYYNLRIIQGRLAEVVGDVVVGADVRRQPEGRNASIRSDVKMRTIGYWRYAQRLADNLDAETTNLLQAYSNGVNAYISSHRSDLLYLFDTLKLAPEPWTPAACIASWWRLGLFFADDGLRDAELYYAIKDGARKIREFAFDKPLPQGLWKGRDETSVVKRSDVTDEWVERLSDYARTHNLTRKIDVTPMTQRPSPRFSHAWVVGGNRTTDGSAVLVSDPQTPVRNPSLWYEFHVSGATFNARGIGVAGSPALLIGFTQNVAWGLSALGADQADLFVLKTDPNRPDQYLYDGKWRDMTVRSETVEVKNGPSSNITVRETHLGPVVSSIVTSLRRGDEVALKRIPICELDRDTFQGVLGMMRAKDVYEFRKALAGWRFPSANCIFGDSKGNIGYMTILALPVRSAKALFEGTAAHEGWTSDADWQGFVPAELLPSVINPRQGWLVTANHRPIESFYPIPMGISTGSMGDTDRSWRLKERLQMKAKFAPEDVLDIHYDMVNPVKRDLARYGYHLRDVQKAALDEDTLFVLDYLKDWYARGAKLDTSIRGTEIMNLMPMAFRQNFEAAAIYGGGLSGLSAMCRTINARLEEDLGANLTGPEAEYVNLMLRAAWRYGKAAYGDDPNLWPQRAKQQHLDTKLEYFSTLDGFESLDPKQDVNYPQLTCIEGGTILSQKAQSYTQYVTLGDVDSSMALLPIGQTEQPADPRRLSGYDLWSQGRCRPAPLSRKRIEQITVSKTILGE